MTDKHDHGEKAWFGGRGWYRSNKTDKKNLKKLSSYSLENEKNDEDNRMIEIHKNKHAVI